MTCPQDTETETQRTITPRSLSLDPNSRFRVSDPVPEGFKRTVLKLLGYYSRQSRLIRGANTLYSRISSQVDQPELYASESSPILKIQTLMQVLVYLSIHDLRLLGAFVLLFCFILCLCPLCYE